MLELARVLKEAEFARTVQFIAVNLEEMQKPGDLESGLCGSRALAAEAVRKGWKLEGVIVLESVAYAGKEIEQKKPAGVPLELPESGDFLSVVGNDMARGLVEKFGRMIGKYKLELPLVPLIVPGKGEALPDTRRSDHAPFWDHGYPAVMLTDTANFRNPHYHQPTDTLETLNLPFAANVCRAVMGVVLEMAM